MDDRPTELDWIDEPVRERKAVDLGSCGGYPDRYAVSADLLMPIITSNSIPNPKYPPIIGDDYVFPGNWR